MCLSLKNLSSQGNGLSFTGVLSPAQIAQLKGLKLTAKCSLSLDMHQA